SSTFFVSFVVKIRFDPTASTQEKSSRIHDNGGSVMTTRFSCTNRNTHYDAVRAVQLINEYAMYMFSSRGNGNAKLGSTVFSCEYQYMRTVKVAGLIAVLVCGVIALGAAPGPETAKMRAIVIHAYGGPEVMKLENVARPERRADEVLIRV